MSWSMNVTFDGDYRVAKAIFVGCHRCSTDSGGRRVS